AKIHIGLEKPQHAVPLLQDSGPVSGSPAVLVEIASTAVSAGHTSAGSNIYGRVSALRPSNEDSLRFASLFMESGDFYRAETIFRMHLAKSPSTANLLKLASVFKATERYPEADYIYRTLSVRSSLEAEILREQADLSSRLGDHEGALLLIRKSISLTPDNSEAVTFAVETLLRLNRPAEALVLCARLSQLQISEKRRMQITAKVYSAAGNSQLAGFYVDEALTIDRHDPDSLSLHCSLNDTEPSSFFLFENNPGRLFRWGEILTAEGKHTEAHQCFQKSVSLDPLNFKSAIAAAQSMSYNKNYSAAIRAYKNLIECFPSNYMLLSGLARTLSWSKDFRESYQVYDRLNALNPSDPVPLIEKARAAFWARNADLSFNTYNRAQAADSQLRSFLSGMIPNDGALEKLSRDRMTDLEKSAKHSMWQGYNLEAMRTLEELLRLAPWNIEARFDYGQLSGRLGLDDELITHYKELYRLNPGHGLVKFVLDNMQSDQRAAAGIAWSHHEEKGHDQTSGNRVTKIGLKTDFPLSPRTDLSLSLERWTERPTEGNAVYRPGGGTLSLRSCFNRRFVLNGAFSLLDYSSAIGQREEGFFDTHWTVSDNLKAGISAGRRLDHSNLFAVRRGIQNDFLSFSTSFSPNRRARISIEKESLSYSDENNGTRFSSSFEYRLKSLPRSLSLAGRLDMRDTDKKTVATHSGDTVVSMIHPYWTPINYRKRSLSLQWRSDLSEYQICGDFTHTLDVRLSISTDNFSNSGGSLEVDWVRSYLAGWIWKLGCNLQRSRGWNSDTLFFSLNRRL
ncbi:MAG: hypothetical protein PHQ23_11540, partial [Candidatus Wallbacteria bacterium]|nr:hypothetical protein [Candidatus Wallbacteria bacterium]